jgi:hypothetical protein
MVTRAKFWFTSAEVGRGMGGTHGIYSAHRNTIMCFVLNGDLWHHIRHSSKQYKTLFFCCILGKHHRYCFPTKTQAQQSKLHEEHVAQQNMYNSRVWETMGHTMEEIRSMKQTINDLQHGEKVKSESNIFTQAIERCGRSVHRQQAPLLFFE